VPRGALYVRQLPYGVTAHRNEIGALLPVHELPLSLSALLCLLGLGLLRPMCQLNL
jgi:hypothetical protein